jgi:peptidoglycan/xylan/chitin deacetylase (PgdA/CDA1 family)
MVGRNVQAFRQVAQDVHDRGHRIGNHSYTHPDLTTLSASQIRQEILKTDALIEPWVGPDKILRPPYGAHNGLVDQIAKNLGYRLVFWNVDTLDWNKLYQPDRWIQHGIDQIRGRDNSLVLNHDIHKTTVDNFDTFIQRIAAIGQVVFQPPSAL